MTDHSSFCAFCGAALAGGANFCESCGKPVAKAVRGEPVPEPDPLPPLPVSSTRAADPTSHYPDIKTYTPPAAASKRSTALPVLLGVGGCLAVLCVGLVLVGGLFLMNNRSTVEEISQVAPTLPSPVLAATATPLPTRSPVPTKALTPTDAAQPTAAAAPTQVEIPPVVWPADIEQQLTDGYFSDNFSSNKYDWADTKDETRTWGFEDGHYMFHLFQPDFSIWAYLPVDFRPTTVSFDAAVQPGFDQGGYGVLCHYQDEDNFHFVSVDPFYGEYSIGYVRDGEYETLMEEMWMESSRLNASPYAVNSIMVVCDLDMTTLFINNELEAQASTSNAQPGDTALFGETWEDTPAAGYKVLIDNLIAFYPKQ